MGKFNQAIKNLMLKAIDYRINYHITKGVYREIEAWKPYWEQVKLTDDQVREIEAIYGKGADVRWHRYYQYFTGVFDPRYLSKAIFDPILEGKLNPRHIAAEMSDKSRVPMLYGNISGLYIPQTVVFNASGIFYDGSSCLLSKEDANKRVKAYLEKHDGAVIKPIRDSYGGDRVALLTKENFTEIPYERDFIIQERIINQGDLRALNPGSLNTMRVITYICDQQYWCAPVTLRMGLGECLVDNGTAGGICVGVKETGELCPQAFTMPGEKYAVHPNTKVKFEGYRIQNVDKVVAAAIECHKRTPHMIMASWDFTINHEGLPTLIEANLTSQTVAPPQFANGRSLFGDNTVKMLEILKE